jgi:cell wall-associated NlpC family hydrolase
VETQSAPADVATAGDALHEVLTRKGFFENFQNSVHDSATRAQEMVQNALDLIGTRYRRGGTSVATGFDCSGFVRAIYEETTGRWLPRTSAEQAGATEKINKSQLKPGDLVFFNTLRRAYSHVGIYIGDGKFVHSPRPGQHVRIEELSMSYWAKRFSGARRLAFN